MFDIDVKELRSSMELEKIDCSVYTDDDLKALIEHYIKVFKSLLTFDYESYDYVFYGMAEAPVMSISLDHHPVQELKSFTRYKEDFTDHIDFLDKEAGVIYLDTLVKGRFQAEYTSGWFSETIEYYLTPVLFDMIVYSVKVSGSGPVTSLKEGEVSVSYNTSDTGLASVRERIDALNKKFGVRAGMIG